MAIANAMGTRAYRRADLEAGAGWLKIFLRLRVNRQLESGQKCARYKFQAQKRGP